jgi:hypothetical protein
LDALGANGLEPLSQAIRIHSRGGADRLEVFIVFEKKLLCLAAEAQWPADPFL